MILELQYDKIRDQLKHFRRVQNLTMKQFAEKIGMSMRGWQAVEMGVNKVRLEHLEKLAKAFEIKIIVEF